MTEVIPLNAPEPGWLYILESKAVEGHCKIGMTSRTPQERADELSTGIPHGLRVVHSWYVEDMRATEQDAHSRLARYRVDPGGEWFALSADAASRALTGATRRDAPARRRFHVVRTGVEIFGWISLGMIAIGLLL